MRHHLNYDGTPRDIDLVALLTDGTLEIGDRDGVVTLQQVGSRGGLSPVYWLAPDDAVAAANAILRRAGAARDRRDAREAQP